MGDTGVRILLRCKCKCKPQCIGAERKQDNRLGASRRGETLHYWRSGELGSGSLFQLRTGTNSRLPGILIISGPALIEVYTAFLEYVLVKDL